MQPKNRPSSTWARPHCGPCWHERDVPGVAYPNRPPPVVHASSVRERVASPRTRVASRDHARDNARGQMLSRPAAKQPLVEDCEARAALLIYFCVDRFSCPTKAAERVYYSIVVSRNWSGFSAVRFCAWRRRGEVSGDERRRAGGGARGRGGGGGAGARGVRGAAQRCQRAPRPRLGAAAQRRHLRGSLRARPALRPRHLRLPQRRALRRRLPQGGQVRPRRLLLPRRRALRGRVETGHEARLRSVLLPERRRLRGLVEAQPAPRPGHVHLRGHGRQVHGHMGERPDGRAGPIGAAGLPLPRLLGAEPALRPRCLLLRDEVHPARQLHPRARPRIRPRRRRNPRRGRRAGREGGGARGPGRGAHAQGHRAHLARHAHHGLRPRPAAAAARAALRVRLARVHPRRGARAGHRRRGRGGRGAGGGGGACAAARLDGRPGGGRGGVDGGDRPRGRGGGGEPRVHRLGRGAAAPARQGAPPLEPAPHARDDGRGAPADPHRPGRPVLAALARLLRGQRRRLTSTANGNARPGTRAVLEPEGNAFFVFFLC